MNYNPTTWKSGDKVTSSKLNKIEQAIVNVDDELADVKEDLNVFRPTATSEDVGKALIVKTVSDGVPTEFEYGEAGGEEIADNSITYAKLHKATNDVVQSKVDFWYYNGEKRTDGTSIEVVPEVNEAIVFTYPTGTNKYRVYYVSDDGTVTTYYDTDGYVGYWDDTANNRYVIIARKAGKIYIPLTFGNTRYFPDDTVVYNVDEPYPTDFLQAGWQPEIMDITVKYPRRVFGVKCYSQNGVAQSLRVQIPTYHIPYVGWYKVKENYSLLDANWNWIKYVSSPHYFYNDGSYAYVQGNGTDKDVEPEYVGDGISAFGDMNVISKHDKLDLNKPFGHAVVCFGDSITSTGYPSKLAELAKCLAINYGDSGANTSYIRKKCTGVGSENATPFDWSANPVDTAIIMAGYNDTYQGTIEGDVPTSKVSDVSNDWAAYLALFNASHSAQGTTCGNIGFMIEWIQANHPNVRIVLCNYHNNTDAKPTRYSDVDTAVKALCEYYGIQYIDIRRTCGINKKNASTYLTDGLHPNDAGQELIAKAIFRAM